MNTLGARIAQKRKAMGLTQEALAEKLAVSSQAVSKWENDVSSPDISLLPQLAKVLNTTVDALLSGDAPAVSLLPEGERKPLEELTLRVYMDSADGDKMRVNLPMPLVKIALELGLDITAGVSNMEGMSGMEAFKKIDLARIMELAEKGLIGRLVEMESADGDKLELVVE